MGRGGYSQNAGVLVVLVSPDMNVMNIGSQLLNFNSCFVVTGNGGIHKN